MVAEGLLGNVEPLGGLGEIELLGGHQKIFQVEKIDHFSIPPPTEGSSAAALCEGLDGRPLPGAQKGLVKPRGEAGKEGGGPF